MKITLNKRIARLVVMSGLALVGSCLTNHLQAQLDPSVLGPAWDFTISGQARGIAQIVFNADGTLVGQVQIETRKKASGGGTSDSDDRGGSSPEDRGGSGSSTNSSSTSSSVTNLAGLFLIDGRWGFDPASHRVIGYLNEGAPVASETETNMTTNSVSFHAVLHGGTHPKMTIQGTSPLGRQVFQGIPLQALPDISGPYAAVGKRGGLSVVEFFTLTATGLNNYSVVGSSPGYTYTGSAILSGRKQLGITTVADGTNGINATMLVGGFNTNNLGTAKSLGSLKGTDSHGPASFKILDQ